MFELEQPCSNNEAKFEALIAKLEILLQHGARNIKVLCDSQLVIKQITKEYKCVNENLGKYLSMVARLLANFDNVVIKHAPR